MEKVFLDCVSREELGKNKMGALRRSGSIPAVVYGKGKKPFVIKINQSQFIKFMHAHHGGENMIISLRISGSENSKSAKKEERSVLIKDIQYEPVHDSLLHVDFNEVSLTEKIVVKLPIEHKGEPEAVKKEGGVLTQVLWELEVECLPTEIPEKVEVNIESMEIGDTIHVKDMQMPGQVSVLTDVEAIAFTLAPPRKVEEEPTEEVTEGEGASTEPEVIKKEKKEGEEEGKEEKPKEGKSEESTA